MPESNKEMETIDSPELDVEHKAGTGKEVNNQNHMETNNDQKPVESTIQETAASETDTKPETRTELVTSSSGLNPNPMEATATKSQDTGAATYDDPETISEPGVTYRCKKCRTLVATEEYVVAHSVGHGERCFATRKTYHVDEDNEPECTCLFVRPLKWMQPVMEGYVSGKISCRKCKTRLGQFHWAGMQCSCGAWVNPAFKLVKSRIDECDM